jgi:predicted acylesterase/phospholipase RssA
MKLIKKFVLSGGGTKCIAFIGVLDYLYQNKDIVTIELDEICCVSGGAMISLLLMLKYSINDIKNIVLNKDFNTLKNIKYTNLLNHWGIDSGKYIIQWLTSQIEFKNLNKNLTFRELFVYNPIKFNVLATNLTTYTYSHFNHITTPDLKVLDAIRMSISIPFVFTKMSYNNDVHVDGGLINNYPIDLYKDCLENVLGFNLISNGSLMNDSINNENNTLEQYINNIINCIKIQREKNMIHVFENSTICIKTSHITNTLNFSLNNNVKINLINEGFTCAKSFFKV